MLYNDYGQTGKKVSAIGFGGMRLPNPGNPEEGIALLHAAHRAGRVDSTSSIILPPSKRVATVR